jgi:hypothetical protein
MTTDIDPSTDTASAASALMNLVIALLAPMFLGVTAGDVRLATIAAAQTVNDYRAQNHADLLAIAQIIAFGLAALASLSLSMADDISLSMMVRLHGNANALNRSAEQNRRAIRGYPTNAGKPRQEPMADPPAAARPSVSNEHVDRARTERLLNLEVEQQLALQSEARLRDPLQAADQPATPSPTLAREAADKRHEAMWAITMVKEAADISASIPNLPPFERRAASVRAASLSTCANDLLYGRHLKPAAPPQFSPPQFRPPEFRPPEFGPPELGPPEFDPPEFDPSQPNPGNHHA